MTVAEVLARTSSHELSEWAAYERITGPLGPARADLHAAIIAATVANSAGGKRKSAPKDFIPKWDKGAQATPEELFQKAMQINAALQGTTRKG